MKRPWQEKIGTEGVRLLESYRELNKLYKLDDFRKWESRGDWEATELIGQSVPTKVELTIHLLDLAGQMPPQLRRSDLKLGHLPKPATICPIVESTPLHYVAQLLKRMRFGSRSRPLSRAEEMSLAAQCFELCAQLCRGKLELPKGKVNLERGELVSLIFQYEKQRLSDEDLRDAIWYAGGNAPEDPQALRLWVWRNQRGGLVRKRKRRR